MARHSTRRITRRPPIFSDDRPIRSVKTHDILLPAFVCFDGFILTPIPSRNRSTFPPRREVDAYLPGLYTLHPDWMPRCR